MLKTKPKKRGQDFKETGWPDLNKPKKRKQKAKTIGKLKKELWDLVSEFVRRSYSDHAGYCSCYTCGNTLPWKQMQAGHGIPGRNNAVLYDLDILRPQDIYCNIFGRGKHHIFAAKMIREHGLEWWEAKLAGADKTVKYSRVDILEMTEAFKARLEGVA
jgi:hypothetical protein